MRENADQNNSEYEHFFRSKNDIQKDLNEVKLFKL